MGKGCCKISYSGYFVASAFMNSNQLSLPEGDLHRIDPVSIPSCTGENVTWFHPSYWQPMAARRATFPEE